MVLWQGHDAASELRVTGRRVLLLYGRMYGRTACFSKRFV